MQGLNGKHLQTEAPLFIEAHVSQTLRKNTSLPKGTRKLSLGLHATVKHEEAPLLQGI